MMHTIKEQQQQTQNPALIVFVYVLSSFCMWFCMYYKTYFIANAFVCICVSEIFITKRVWREI